MSDDTKDETENSNFVDDIKETVKTRFSNPFFFSYIFSWIILNWRFISFMFFSNKTIEDKLEEYGHYINVWGWVCPLLGVALYLIGLNYIDSFFLLLGKHGYKRKVDGLKHRSSIKIEAEVEIAQEKIDLQAKKIKADQIENLIKETERLNSALKETELTSKNKDTIIADLRKEKGSKKPNNDFVQIVSGNNHQNTSGFNFGLAPSRSLSEIEKLLGEANLINDFLSISGSTGSNSQGFGSFILSNSENIDLYRRLGLVDNYTSMLTDLGKKMVVYLKADGSNDTSFFIER